MRSWQEAVPNQLNALRPMEVRVLSRPTRLVPTGGKRVRRCAYLIALVVAGFSVGSTGSASAETKFHFGPLVLVVDRDEDQ